MAEPESQGTLSEDALIARYFRPLAQGFPGAFDLRDDAAVLAPPEGCELVVTTDMLVAGVHFLPGDDPADIAWKALAVNVSDLAAKAAQPLAYSLAMALPGLTEEAWLARFADGLRQAQQAFGIALSGGDTTVSPHGPLTLSVTAFGSVPKGRMARRGGAGAGESLYVTGTIGDAAIGLALHVGEADASRWPPLDESARTALIGRYLRPKPRLRLRDALLAHATAAMDISDGLVIDCARMCRASSVGARIEAERVPLSPPVRSLVKANPGLLARALTGGDDYEILAAIRPGEEPAFERAAAIAGLAVTAIGTTEAAGGELIVAGADGQPMAFDRPGYDHFAGVPGRSP